MTPAELNVLVQELNGLHGAALVARLQSLSDEELAEVIGHSGASDETKRVAKEEQRNRQRPRPRMH